jgi:hypothetical protein
LRRLIFYTLISLHPASHGHSSTEPRADRNLSYNLLGDRLSQLEQGVDRVSNDIRAFVAKQGTVQPKIEQDTQELVDIARSLVMGASSVATTSTVRSTVSTIKAFDSSDITSNDINTEENDEDSVSVLGIPLTAQRRYHLDEWIHTSAPDSTSHVPSIAASSIYDTSADEHTPPSTAQNQDDLDLETEIIKRRWEKVKQLVRQQQHKAAIPHLRRTMDTIKDYDRLVKFDGAPSYREVQITLATAMLEDNPTCQESEPLLREVFESKETKPLERFTAAHLLAKLLFNLQPQDWMEVKITCLIAIKGRMATLGRTDPKTYKSIALLADICRASGDSDEEIWRDMLPEGYSVDTKQRSTNQFLDEKSIPHFFWKRANAEDIGVFPAEAATELFTRTKIPEDTLAEIWEMAEPNGLEFLTWGAYCKAMRLVAHCQVQPGLTLSPELLKMASPPGYPKFEGLVVTADKSVDNATLRISPQNSGSIRIPTLSEDRIAAYTDQFKQNSTENGTIPGMLRLCIATSVLTSD